MSILIKGMEMPDFGALNILILPDGKVLGEVSGQAPLEVNILGTAIPIPPHGRLIDENDITPSCDWDDIDGCFTSYSQIDIDCAPTIIEAEG